MTINDIERKRAYSLCEAIVIGFQNEARDKKVYDTLQAVYERIHEELQPILDRETIEANEERGVKALSKYLSLPEYITKFMLTDREVLDIVVSASKEKAPEVKACYVGDLHQQILISSLEGDPIKVISVWEDQNESKSN